MKKYMPLFVFFIVVAALLHLGGLSPKGYADDLHRESRREIVVYAALPQEQADILAAVYRKYTGAELKFVLWPETEFAERLAAEVKAGKCRADMVLARREILLRLAAGNLLAQSAADCAEGVRPSFRDPAGRWIGIWYDPLVFCVNKDYIKRTPHLSVSWDRLGRENNIRLGVNDFLTSDAAANLLFTMVAEYNEKVTFEFLNRLHDRVVQYAKDVSGPVRMAGMGEVDISLAPQSEVIKYINDGFPLAVVYPEEGTSYILMGAAIMAGRLRPDTEEALGWLLTGEAQLKLQEHRCFYMPTNEDAAAYKIFGVQQVNLFENYSELSQPDKLRLLDRWAKTVRWRDSD